MNLKSSSQKKGTTVTQIVTAVSGIKKTFPGVKTDTIAQSEFTQFETTDGRLVLINTKNVAWVEVFGEDTSQTIGDICTVLPGYRTHMFVLDPKDKKEKCFYCNQIK